MCNCNSGQWLVTYPDGRTEVKPSQIAARIAANRVPNSRYEKLPPK